ncbi:MAG: hypothetical protein AAF311_14440 [Pseudomonadota bacterium]
MQSNTKLWSRLGLTTALSAGLIGAGCAAETETAMPETPTADAPMSQMSGPEAPALAGEAGEGEGGVSIAQASTDPVVFRSVLAITEAHLIAGRDAYAEGRTDAAGEMFAHPVSEVLAEMEPIFRDRGVDDFTDMLLDASDAAYSGVPSEDIAARVAAIIATLRKVEASAPDNGMSEGEIAARVVADQIDRAADMYGVAQGSDAYEPYLDGYGFYKAALAVRDDHMAAIVRATSERTQTTMQAALDLLDTAYPTASRPETLGSESGRLRAAASSLMLSLG